MHAWLICTPSTSYTHIQILTTAWTTSTTKEAQIEEATLHLHLPHAQPHVQALKNRLCKEVRTLYNLATTENIYLNASVREIECFLTHLSFHFSPCLCTASPKKVAKPTAPPAKKTQKGNGKFALPPRSIFLRSLVVAGSQPSSYVSSLFL